MGGAPAEPKTPKAGSREPSFNADVEHGRFGILFRDFLRSGASPDQKGRKTRVIAIELIIHGIYYIRDFFDKNMVPYRMRYIDYTWPSFASVGHYTIGGQVGTCERHWCIHIQLSRSWRWCSHPIWHCRSKSHNILKSFMLRFQTIFAKLHDPYHCHSEALVILCDLIENAPWMLFSIKPLWGHLCEKKAR